jgi:hypothetical protein
LHILFKRYDYNDDLCCYNDNDYIAADVSAIGAAYVDRWHMPHNTTVFGFNDYNDDLRGSNDYNDDLCGYNNHDHVAAHVSTCDSAYVDRWHLPLC